MATTEERVQQLRQRIMELNPNDVAVETYERLLMMEILLEVKHLLQQVTLARVTYSEPLKFGDQ